LSSLGTHDRPRFIEQMDRLSKYQVKALVIEATWHDFARGAYRSQVNTKSVTGTLLKLVTEGIPVMLAESPQYAAEIVERILTRVLKQSIGKAA
jgi:ERCC4-type nuclease